MGFRKVLPVSYPLRQCTVRALLKMPAVGILTDDEREPDIWQQAQKLLPPGRRTLPPRRQVTRRSSPRIAKSHRQNRKLLRIIENLAINPHPVAQAVTAWIIKRDTGLVHPCAGSLRRNQNARPAIHLKDRPGSKRQMSVAKPAGGGVFLQGFEGSVQGHGQGCLILISMIEQT